MTTWTAKAHNRLQGSTKPAPFNAPDEQCELMENLLAVDATEFGQSPIQGRAADAQQFRRPCAVATRRLNRSQNFVTFIRYIIWDMIGLIALWPNNFGWKIYLLNRPGSTLKGRVLN